MLKAIRLIIPAAWREKKKVKTKAMVENRLK